MTHYENHSIPFDKIYDFDINNLNYLNDTSL